MQMVDFFTLWVPLSHLKLYYWERFELLVRDAPDGRFFAFVIDRVCTLLVILGMCSFGGDGSLQCGIFAAACLFIGVSHVRPGIASGFDTWIAAGKEEIRQAEEQITKDSARKEDAEEDLWPFHEDAVYRQFKRLQQIEQDNRWRGASGLLRRWLYEPCQKLSKLNIWKTRAMFTTREIILNPALTELLKYCILSILFTTHSSIQFLSDDVGSSTAIIFAIAALYIVNFRSLRTFVLQVKTSLAASAYWCSAILHFVEEKARELPILMLRIKLYCESVES